MGHLSRDPFQLAVLFRRGGLSLPRPLPPTRPAKGL